MLASLICGKNDKPPLGRPRITTPFEVQVIVTSTWRNRFMAASKLFKFLSHATDTRISVCITKNRLRGAKLIFELWNLNFNIDHFVYFFMKKMGLFRNILLKMFTFVRHNMNFVFSKIFVNIKTVVQKYCTQCLYWLNFFFWVYYLSKYIVFNIIQNIASFKGDNLWETLWNK